MTAVRVFEYTVSENAISPSTVAKGGVQGEHNATCLNFILSLDLKEKLRELTGTDKSLYYRFDGIDGLGVRYSFDAEELDLNSTELSFSVGRVLTQYGGTVEIYLVITLNGENGTEMELFSYSVKLALKPTPETDGVAAENGDSISTLAVMVKNNAKIAEAAREYALEAQNKTEAARAALEQGTEWIFEGGDSTTEIKIESMLDGSMSDTSTEAVQNCVVKKYVDDSVDSLKADYITEQGTDGIWTYRKWASGIAECWGNTEAEEYTLSNTYTSGRYGESEYIFFPEGLFSSAPTANVGFNSESGTLPRACVSEIGSVGVELVPYDGNSTKVSGFYMISVKGRWKE